MATDTAPTAAPERGTLKAHGLQVGDVFTLHGPGFDGLVVLSGGRVSKPLDVRYAEKRGSRIILQPLDGETLAPTSEPSPATKVWVSNIRKAARP